MQNDDIMPEDIRPDYEGIAPDTKPLEAEEPAKEKIDPRKLIIYSEIMSPKFDK